MLAEILVVLVVQIIGTFGTRQEADVRTLGVSIK